MKIDVIKDFSKRKAADCIILPFFQDESPVQAFSKIDFSVDYSAPILSKDFTGRFLQNSLLYSSDKEKRIVLLGLGKKKDLTDEMLRNAIAESVSIAQKLKVKKLNIALPTKYGKASLLKTCLEGAFLSNYLFHKLKKKTLSEINKQIVEEITFIGVSPDKKLIDKVKAISTAVHMTRDLVNNNADDETPQRLGIVAKDLAKLSEKIKVQIFNKEKIEKEKLDLLLAVNRGSFREPIFIVLEYLGDKRSKDNTVLVGKGITYDSGGLSLKPTDSMYTMKSDMAGAASVLGTMYALANLGVKKNVTAVIPATENSIGSKSYKPGDVYNSHKGITVEIGNTDAEGRLILADALSYATSKLNPSRIIDVATLTGAISISLGREIAGLFCNDKNLVKGLIKSSENTGELLWNMPLHNQYKKMLDSQVADINNVGGREGGSITAALFLQEFIDKKIPWAHIDIGGSSYYSKPKGYYTSLATGYGVRLLVDFIENL